MPDASVWSNHICCSCGYLYTLRQRGVPVDHAAATLVAILPFCTALHTRPCSAQPQIGVSSPPRPWLSHWNHSQTSLTVTRLAVLPMPPPRLKKYNLDD